MSQLTKNSVVEASIRRLKAMGLNVSLIPDGDNEAYIIIPVNDLIEMLRKSITYQNKKITFEKDLIVIYIWRKG